MGNNNSATQYDILDEEGINYSLFKELHLVILGCHGSGKNEIGNAILRKKVFTYFTSFKKHYITKKRTVFGTTVTLVRVPGWSGELGLDGKHRELRQEIKDAVSSFEHGPHAIILAIKVNSTLTETTQTTLEKLFTENIWDHTIVILTGGNEQMSREDTINKMNIRSLVNTCGGRRLLLKPNSFEQSKKLLENIALMIAEKRASSYPLNFCIDESEQYDESHDKNTLLKRLQRKITKLREYTSTRATRIRREESVLDITKLENIMMRIQGGPEQSGSSQSVQPTIESRNTERGESTTDVEIHPTETSSLLGYHETSLGNHLAPDCHELKDFNCGSYEPNSKVSDLEGWCDTLVHILTDLNEEQLEKMRGFLYNRGQHRIPRGRVEGQSPNKLAELMNEHWGERECIVHTRDLLKAIPRNDKNIKDLIIPFLQKIGETW